ncbi:MAG: hypothetical protein ABSG45_01400 [Nitrososphaerales archaeon]
MKRSRMGAIVAIAVVLVVVALAAFVIVGRSDSSKCSSTGTSLATMFGRISVPNGPTGSNFTLTVINSTCSPITGITVTSVQPQIAGVVNSTFVEYNGTVVNPSNPLPEGQLGTGSLAVSGIDAGQKYVFTIAIDFSSGSVPQTETMEIYPQN